MEVVFFNADYEEVLYSKTPELIRSNSKNSQFEFLAWLLGNKTIYTERKYDDSYLKFIEDLSELKIEISHDKTNIKRFWGSIYPLELMRKLNSKLTSSELSLKYKLNNYPLTFKDGPFFLHENEIAKSPFSFSGRGHLKGPRDIHSLDKFIVEKRLNRTLDFSSLCFKDKTVFYKNIVDSNFAYKGTLLFKDNESLHFLSKNIEEEHLKNLEIIRENYDEGLDFFESYTIDSFLYEDGSVKLNSLCEVNYRNTMGKMAYLLSKRYLSNFKIFFLGLTKIKPQIRSSLNHLYLSDENNFLHLIFLGANSEDEILALRKKFKC